MTGKEVALPCIITGFELFAAVAEIIETERILIPGLQGKAHNEKREQSSLTDYRCAASLR